MQNYVAIEHNSGFVWGSVAAGTPEAACAAIGVSANRTLPASVWERCAPISDTGGGVHLYRAPAGFPDVTADDYEIVADLCDYVGDYRATQPE